MIRLPTYRYVLSMPSCEPPWPANDDLASGDQGGFAMALARTRSGDPPPDGDAPVDPVAFVSYARCNPAVVGHALKRQHAGNLEAGLALPGRHVADFGVVGRVGPGFRDLLELLRAGGARAVVIEDAARLGRDMRDSFVNFKALEYHAAVYVAERPTTPSKPVASRLSRYHVLVDLALSGSRPGTFGRTPGTVEGRL